MNAEILASIKILVGVAKADGEIHPNEEQAIANALESAALPAGTTVASLFGDYIDVEAEIAKVTSAEVRTRTYEAACAMVYVDGEAAPAEKKILDRLRQDFGLEPPTSVLDRIKKNLRQDWAPSTIDKVIDPSERDREVDAAILRASLTSGALGSFPLPMVGELLVGYVEIRMLQLLGYLYGHKGDATFWKAWVSGVAGVTASRFAIQSLLKLVPGWGSIAGATGSFATTWGLGKAAKLYFEKGEDIDPAALKGAFKSARTEGVARAKESTDAIVAEQTTLANAKAQLDSELADGTLTEAEYAERLVKQD